MYDLFTRFLTLYLCFVDIPLIFLDIVGRSQFIMECHIIRRINNVGAAFLYTTCYLALLFQQTSPFFL